MDYKEILILNINKIHTTTLGIKRIENNLGIKCDMNYLKDKIIKSDCVYKKGKNYYCEIDNIKLTININNYCIITAHIMK